MVAGGRSFCRLSSGVENNSGNAGAEHGCQPLFCLQNRLDNGGTALFNSSSRRSKSENSSQKLGVSSGKSTTREESRMTEWRKSEDGRRGIGNADGPDVRRTTCSDMQCTWYMRYILGLAGPGLGWASYRQVYRYTYSTIVQVSDKGGVGPRLGFLLVGGRDDLRSSCLWAKREQMEHQTGRRGRARSKNSQAPPPSDFHGCERWLSMLVDEPVSNAR